MAEPGCAALPVPSITVTFLSTVVSARAGLARAVAANSAAMAAPNLRLRIVLNSLEVFLSAAGIRSYGTGGGKKSASLTLHCDMAASLWPGEKNAAFFWKAAPMSPG
jgi:hypothetical protein